MKKLDEVAEAIKSGDSVKLRELASHYSDEASTTQGEDMIKLAMVTYCFHKIYIKLHMREKTEEIAEKAVMKLGEHDFDGILSEIDKFDSEHGFFEGGLVGKARIKIASRLHSRGVSVTQAASLTGANVSDLLDYVGETKGYRPREGKSVAERLNLARDILK